jgi:Kef-type K+ transport system membrane component KefB
MDSIFSELSLVIVVTAAVSILMKVIRQPLILGYILSGLLVGPSVFNMIHSTELFDAFSSLGIALLLFIIGLGMNIGELKRSGKTVALLTLASLTTITTVGFAAASAMGFGRAEALVTGLALFFSSTIIIIKILSDKKEQNRLHGQIAIGIILLEDIVATFALLFIAAGKDGNISIAQIAPLFLKGLLLLGLLMICSQKILPRVSRYMASTQELLFLFAIGWGFGIASLFELAGFSIEVGALFSGVALAGSPYVQEIAARLRPLRDFFIVLFFISLGQKMNLTNISDSILPALVFSLIAIIGKPLVITTVMGLLGYTKRVSFKAGINLSQISEFSIVLVVLAVNEGIVRSELSSIITLVAIITIAVSTFLTHYDEQLFRQFEKIRLRIFEKEVVHREKRGPAPYQLVLFGYHHGGHEFIRAFQDMHKRFLVIDYDPEVIDLLDHQKIDYLYGDATDMELLQEAGIDKSKLLVSTITDHPTNLFIIKLIEQMNPDAAVICHADNIKQATALYEAGASYVMIPHHIGSERMSAFIKRAGVDKTYFQKYRQKHLAYLHAHLSGPEPDAV